MPRINTRSSNGGAPATPHSSTAEIEAALAVLQANKDAWARLGIEERIAILDRILEDMPGVTEEWVALGIEAKGVRGNAYGEAEEWGALALVVRNVRLLGKSLRDIRDHGRPRIPGSVTTQADGRVVARVFPQSLFDRLMLPGTTAEVWMQPGVTAEETHDTQARFYRDGAAPGKVVLILGAGNASFLIPSDFLYKLFVEGKVVILKLHPVNTYLRPVLERGFQALVKAGFLRFVDGDVEEGTYLCNHPAVDELHMTGSDRTYEAVVFGPGAEGARRKAERRPLIEKRFTAELGNVTPMIVVPGPWSDADVASQGERLARWLATNAGFTCLTPRVIVQHAGWEQRESLNRATGEVLSQVATRRAYYPGAEQRMAQFIAAHPEAGRYGAAQSGYLPWTFITGVDPGNSQDICFRSEAFCGLFAETALEAPGVEAFLDQAVRFANDTLWGNLTATIIAHPASLKDPKVSAAIERAVADLRYGMVLINQFGVIGTLPVTTTWGAYPGNDPYDIQSGTGVTFNALMFEAPQKSVVRSPFVLWPDPFSVTSRTIAEFCKRLADFQCKPSLRKLPGYIWTALRS